MIASAGAAATAHSAAIDAPTATVASGKLRGRTVDGIAVFKGIPYGATTAGGHRFRRPQPVQPWTGIRDALTFPSMAPQPPSPIRGLFASWSDPSTVGEDCLGLNVWTPAVHDSGKRPVMVWLHGGDFVSLSGSRSVFDGVRLARRGDVVVVTVNHRLNIFGFMYLGQLLPEFADAANAGLLDLIAALQWVRDNIAEFGGDPNNVTIFGQSGGGGKVSHLMAMPAAKGLFHRAIVQSGSYARNAHLEAMSPQTATKHTQTLLAELGLKDTDARKLLELPLDALIAATARSTQAAERAVWRPVADGQNVPDGPSWPKAPVVSTDIPLMIGTTATEMSMLMGTARPDLFDLDDARMRKRLSNWYGPDQLDDIITLFRAKSPGASPGRLFFDIATASVFRRGAWLHAELKAAQNAAPVYLYEIDWETPVDGGKWGSPHSVEHAFVFDNVAQSESMVGPPSDQTQAMTDQISESWLAFARNGNPNNQTIPHWAHYSAQDRTTMVFDTTSTAEKLFREEERLLVQKAAPYDPL